MTRAETLIALTPMTKIVTIMAVPRRIRSEKHVETPVSIRSIDPIFDFHETKNILEYSVKIQIQQQHKNS